MEEEIKEGFSEAKIALIEGSGGMFEVTCDGTILFSKLDLIGTDRERFPETGEILSLLRRSS